MPNKTMQNNIYAQSAAFIVEYCNQNRKTSLKTELSSINTDYFNSVEMLNAGIKSIKDVIKSNRGGIKGSHGFIAERAQTYLVNSKSLAYGDIAHYTLVDDNGPVDYLYDNIMIQQKACRSGNLGLDHIEIHANTYPFYVSSGGIYQIPKDFYERYQFLSDIPKELTSKLRKEDYRLWLAFNEFNNNNSDIIIKPMDFTYDEIQVNTINDTIERVRNDNKEVYLSRRELARQIYKANIRECAKISVISATSEGVLTGGSCCFHKLREKELKDFNKADAIEIGKESLKGAGIGALRSSSIYFITNNTKLSGPVASASVTATCGIIKEAKKLSDGKTTRKEFATNSAWLCTDAAVGIVASKLGTKYMQNVLPGKTKILAPIISNLLIMPLYSKVKNTIISKNEERKNGDLDEKQNIKTQYTSKQNVSS